jgi:hypothetical protein
LTNAAPSPRRPLSPSVRSWSSCPSWTQSEHRTAPLDRSKPQDLRHNFLRQNYLRHNRRSKTLRLPKVFAHKHFRQRTIVLTDTSTNGWCAAGVATRLFSITYSHTF